jgi:hypothetical protein
MFHWCLGWVGGAFFYLFTALETREMGDTAPVTFNNALGIRRGKGGSTWKSIFTYIATYDDLVLRGLLQRSYLCLEATAVVGCAIQDRMEELVQRIHEGGINSSETFSHWVAEAVRASGVLSMDLSVAKLDLSGFAVQHVGGATATGHKRRRVLTRMEEGESKEAEGEDAERPAKRASVGS